jgi:NAD+ synthase (glutamine-hydrolysing)
MDMSEFVRVATITPVVHIGDMRKNAEEIANTIRNSDAAMNSEIIVTPELALVGYTAQDLLFMQDINTNIQDGKLLFALRIIQDAIKINQIAVVGSPVVINNKLYNCAIVVGKSDIIGITVKTYLPNYSEFYEKRWFTGADEIELPEYIYIRDKRVAVGNRLIYHLSKVNFGVEICEDLWSVYPPSLDMAVGGAEIILNLSASNETIGKSQYRRELVKQQSARCLCGYVYCSAGMSESTSDLVFSGHNIVCENGRILTESEKFNTSSSVTIADIDVNIIRHDRLQNSTFRTSSPLRKVRKVSTGLGVIDRQLNVETVRKIDMLPFVPSNDLDKRCKEIFDIQVAGLASRWMHTGSKKLMVGVSGGLDSTLALLVAVGAANKIDRPHSDIRGITMPCFGTTDRTKNNALNLMSVLGVDYNTIDIGHSVRQHMEDINIGKNDGGVAYENCQARERTQVLMDLANKENGFVVGTGDLSELALGWCTYNGDHMSMYNVNSSIPKTLVRAMVASAEQYGLVDKYSKERFLNTINDILDTPVSPELLPPDENGNITQLTEDSIGPYVLNDFFLYYTVRYGVKSTKLYKLAVEASRQSDVYKYKSEEIKKWLLKFYERFAKSQFKRNCCPDGVKVGSVSFSPRGDWRMPSEAELSAQIDNLKTECICR